MSKKRQEALAMMKKELSEEHLSKKYGTIWKENVAARKLLHAHDEKTNGNQNPEKDTRRSQRNEKRGGKRGRSKSVRLPPTGKPASNQDLGEGTADGAETNAGPLDNKVRIRKKVRKKISVKRIKPDKNKSL